MGLIAHPVVGKAKSRMLCEAFIAGAPKDAHGHVFYGVNESNVTAWAKVKLRGEDWYYIDNSFFDCVRGQQFRVAKNRVQVDPAGRTSDGTRFAALGLEMAPWQSNPAGHVVLAEQSPSFMRTVACEPDWFHKTLLSYDRERLVVRGWHGDKLKQQATLAVDLRRAQCLVTHSSAAAVTALLAGVQVQVEPLSAVHNFTDRLALMQALADGQFDVNEMKTGEAWAWLNK